MNTSFTALTARDRGSEFRTRDPGYPILIFTVLWKSESELRITGN
eukprot:COSAG02_NODE_39213_length_419_cov_3.878125_1_plen_44_part_01